MNTLTPRERQVLELIAQAKTNKQIAAALFISPITVGNHVGRIMSKMQVPNRTAAALAAATLNRSTHADR